MYMIRIASFQRYSAVILAPVSSRRRIHALSQPIRGAWRDRGYAARRRESDPTRWSANRRRDQVPPANQAGQGSGNEPGLRQMARTSNATLLDVWQHLRRHA